MNPAKRARSSGNEDDFVPHSSFTMPLLTDMYQISMAYAYFVNKKHEEESCFDLFFRKNPFGGEFTVFAGLDECLRFLNNFKFCQEDTEYLKTILPADADPAFFDWLLTVDCAQVKVLAQKECSLVFPRVPLLRLTGPLAIIQLLETPLLNLINYPSLVCTQAARLRLAAGPEAKLIEFGLRRAQGPNGAMSASHYSYLGGFNATSNVLAGLNVSGTHAHSFISAFTSLDSVLDTHIVSKKTGEKVHVLPLVLEAREKLPFPKATVDSELAAFISFAFAMPERFLGLVDTYDSLLSGVPNYLAVAVVLYDLGYKPLGIRLDSGDLAYLSVQAREMFKKASETFGYPDMETLDIVASNDINEAVLQTLQQQGHSITVFGIGTNLVTCQKQPALGGVFKLVQHMGKPRIKLSHEIEKMTIPAMKNAYRLYNSSNKPIVDLMTLSSELAPEVGKRILCRHPVDEAKRAIVNPSQVENLLQVVWDGKVAQEAVLLAAEKQKRLLQSLQSFRSDHLRVINPTPYKVSTSEELYTFMHKLWQQEMPLQELS